MKKKRKGEGEEDKETEEEEEVKGKKYISSYNGCGCGHDTVCSSKIYA